MLIGLLIVSAVHLVCTRALGALCPPLPGPIPKQIPGVNPIVCPLNIGPLWYICGAYNYELAVDACAAYGWRLAMLTEGNARSMATLASSCAGVFDFPWIGGVHGLAGAPCAWSQVFNDTIMGLLNLGNLECGRITAGVICEEIPSVAVNQTTTIPFPIVTSGQKTITTTTIRTRTVSPFDPQCTDCTVGHHESSSNACSSSELIFSSDDSFFEFMNNHPDCSFSFHDSSSSSGSESESNHRRRFHKSLQNTTPTCYGVDCLPVCNYTVHGIHMITGLVNYNDTAVECAKYGWSVLDFTTGQSLNVIKVLSECARGAEEKVAFIHSYNGVRAECPTVQTFGFDVGEVALVKLEGSGEMCGEFPKHPIMCQEGCPLAVVASGVEGGLVDYSTSITATLVPLTTPTTTKVVKKTCTETIYTRIFRQ